MTIREICSHFELNGKYVGCSEVSSGNINSTYCVRLAYNGETKQYILQRINKEVFKEPEKVMDNIIRVTHHIRMNIIKNGESTKTGVLRAFSSRESDEPFIIDEFGEYWRCYRCIPNSVTYDSCDDLTIIARAGSAFGKFQEYLKDFPAITLFLTIPDFHNTQKRYLALKDAINKDPYKRVSKVKSEINKLMAFEEDACLLQSLIDNGKIPLRVTHNDTKCNNISFDKSTGKALAVLDLDTVMPGAIAHDFGDAIRYIANTVVEDDPDTDAVALDLEKYEAFTMGFVPEIRNTISDKEKETLNLGVFAMTVELATRFLADYIMGDKYFKTNYPGHNLERARNQIALATDIFNKKEKMDEIIQKYI